VRCVGGSGQFPRPARSVIPRSSVSGGPVDRATLLALCRQLDPTVGRTMNVAPCPMSLVLNNIFWDGGYAGPLHPSFVPETHQGMRRSAVIAPTAGPEAGRYAAFLPAKGTCFIFIVWLLCEMAASILFFSLSRVGGSFRCLSGGTTQAR
jgi:hypothetical protein